MRLLSRYVIRQLLTVFLFSLFGMTVVMILVGVVREALDKSLGVVQIAQLLPYILPDALRFAIPATILFATCSVYGRMSSSNEIVAVKSMGISPMKLLWPTYVVVAVISLVAVYLNDVAVSWGRDGVRRVVIESLEEVAYNVLAKEKTFSQGQFAINVRDVQGKRLLRPTVTFQSGESTPSITIRAEWAELHADPRANTLTILLHNGNASGGGVNMEFPGTIERVLPISPEDAHDRRSASSMPLADIPSAIVQQQELITDLQQQIAAEAGIAMIAGDYFSGENESWKSTNAVLDRAVWHFHRLQTEPHRRWASGLSCLCFVAVGAPLAIRLKNSDFLTSFFLCFLPILLVYYPLLMFGLDRAKNGALPPETVWLGNVVLLAAGALMLRKVIRY